MSSSPLSPRHWVDIGGVKYPLRYELLDWAEAQRITGEPLLPWGATEFWDRALAAAQRQMKDGAEENAGERTVIDAEAMHCNFVLLFVGIRRAIPGLTMDALADMVTLETSDGVFDAVAVAVADFWARVRAKVEKAAGAANPSTAETGSTGSGPSAGSTADSPSGTSGV